MPRMSNAALRRLEAHNVSPETVETNSRQRRSRPSRRSRSRERSSRGSSRHESHRSQENFEESVPRWAQQLLDAQKESDERLKTLESEIRATSKQIKKRKHSPTPEFKFKRNKIQYDLNKSVLDKIENALELSDDEQRCLVLNEGKELLVERNKHIKLAEKYGWETVDCYIEEPLASDSEDDKKIRRAVKESKVTGGSS